MNYILHQTCIWQKLAHTLCAPFLLPIGLTTNLQMVMFLNLTVISEMKNDLSQ